jgi:hypothetical protein
MLRSQRRRAGAGRYATYSIMQLNVVAQSCSERKSGFTSIFLPFKKKKFITTIQIRRSQDGSMQFSRFDLLNSFLWSYGRMPWSTAAPSISRAPSTPIAWPLRGAAHLSKIHTLQNRFVQVRCAWVNKVRRAHRCYLYRAGMEWQACSACQRSPRSLRRRGTRGAQWGEDGPLKHERSSALETAPTLYLVPHLYSVHSVHFVHRQPYSQSQVGNGKEDRLHSTVPCTATRRTGCSIRLGWTACVSTTTASRKGNDSATRMCIVQESYKYCTMQLAAALLIFLSQVLIQCLAAVSTTKPFQRRERDREKIEVCGSVVLFCVHDCVVCVRTSGGCRKAPRT